MDRRLQLARSLEGMTYRLWEEWRDAPDPFSRKLALKAKTFAVVVFDRCLRQEA
jgi:hypothetical protein